MSSQADITMSKTPLIDTITQYEGPATLIAGQKKYEIEIQARLSLVRRNTLVIECVCPLEVEANILDNLYVKLEVPGVTCRFDLHFLRYDTSTHRHVFGASEVPIQVFRGERVQCVVATLAGTREIELNPNIRHCSVFLVDADWTVKLISDACADPGLVENIIVPNSTNVDRTCLIATSRRPGGHRAAEIREFLYALAQMLSFACGRWVTTVGAKGYGSDGTLTYEQWGAERFTAIAEKPWLDKPSWFHPSCGSALCDLFPGFMHRWRSAADEEVLKLAVYWFIQSNQKGAGLDSAIALLQIGLEMMSYDCLTQIVQIKHEKVRSMRFSDQLRLLLAYIKIPLEVPPALTDLRAFCLAKNRGWDGPRALAEARNDVVHPRRKHTLEHIHYFQAWNLGQEYLSLAILYFCGFRGTYISRLNNIIMADAPQRVPWAE